MAGIAAAAGQDAENGRRAQAALSKHRIPKSARHTAAITTRTGTSVVPTNSSIIITASGSIRIIKRLPPSGLRPRRRNSKRGPSNRAWAITSPPS
jgi:hypothetical protein